MQGTKAPYVFLLTVLILFNGLIFTAPLVASQDAETGNLFYLAFSPTCHQLASRSLCIFKSSVGGSITIGDCLPTSEFSSSRANELLYADKTGYKIPVCARDVAIYLSMLLGLLALPFVRKIESEEWPSKWLLVAAAVPIAIDGFTQLFGLRESSNLLRIITGAIIGFALPFYILPMLNSLCSFALEIAGRELKQIRKKKE